MASEMMGFCLPKPDDVILGIIAYSSDQCAGQLLYEKLKHFFLLHLKEISVKYPKGSEGSNRLLALTEGNVTL